MCIGLVCGAASAHSYLRQSPSKQLVIETDAAHHQHASRLSHVPPSAATLSATADCARSFATRSTPPSRCVEISITSCGRLHGEHTPHAMRARMPPEVHLHSIAISDGHLVRDGHRSSTWSTPIQPLLRNCTALIEHLYSSRSISIALSWISLRALGRYPQRAQGASQQLVLNIRR